ncbi:MAG: hypothetical protein ATN34_02260 [Epulopiscium sp. Nele67-Bin002]|nr:MAG: hypothetical protein ATN34_02260 [Epulopiscium sp. Nele67-Bin002]
MKPYTISYLFLEGLKGLWKNRMMAIASVATIVLSLSVLGVSYSIAQNFDYLMKQLQVQMGITAYVSEWYSEDDIIRLQQKVKDIPNVEEVVYISKDEALQMFAADDASLYENFKDDNPLPPSLEVMVSDIVYQQTIADSLAAIDGLEVSYFEAETKVFIKLNNSIQIFSFVLMAILAIISLLLITNTIKLTLFIRKREIEIMKHIGATDSFIRVPFLVEGLTIGIIGAIIPSFIIFHSYIYVDNQVATLLSTMFGGISLKSVEEVMSGLIPIYAILAIGISAIGSAIAISRHLNV